MFSDASEKAFGAVGYLRFELLDGTVKVAFVLAKAKVASVKYESIPRLEPCGCLVAVKMAKTLLSELWIRIRQVILFTDSTTNLRWFNSKSCRFTPYVANRVGEILESFWRSPLALRTNVGEFSRRRQPRSSGSRIDCWSSFLQWAVLSTGSSCYLAGLSRSPSPSWVRAGSRS